MNNFLGKDEDFKQNKRKAASQCQLGLFSFLKKRKNKLLKSLVLKIK